MCFGALVEYLATFLTLIPFCSCSGSSPWTSDLLSVALEGDEERRGAIIAAAELFDRSWGEEHYVGDKVSEGERKFHDLKQFFEENKEGVGERVEVVVERSDAQGGKRGANQRRRGKRGAHQRRGGRVADAPL